MTTEYDKAFLRFPAFNLEKVYGSFIPIQFLRRPGGLALPNGPAYVRSCVESNSILPYSNLRLSLSMGIRWLILLRDGLRWIRSTMPVGITGMDGIVSAPLAFGSEAHEESFVSRGIVSAIQGMGQANEAFQSGLMNAILSNRVATSLKDASYIVIDADSFPIDRLGGIEGQNLVKLMSALHDQVSSVIKPNSEVVIKYSHDNAAILRGLESMVARANRQLQGVNFHLVKSNPDSTSLREMFVKAGIPEKNLKTENMFVLSMQNEKYSEGKLVVVEGLPHLALAAFAYTHYKQPDSVLQSLVDLFRSFMKLKLGGILSDRIIADFISRTMA